MYQSVCTSLPTLHREEGPSVEAEKDLRDLLAQFPGFADRETQAHKKDSWYRGAERTPKGKV